MDDPLEFVPPFVSPLTHDQHARLGRIAILWGQIDMMLDQLLMIALGLAPKQYRTLVGEKPIGGKLDMLKGYINDVPDPPTRELVSEFWDLTNQTKAQRNRSFHGTWGYRCKNQKVVPAAAHFKSGEDPVRATQLPALEKKLCKTARVGYRAMLNLRDWEELAAGRLFHGPGAPPDWLEEWKAKHPLDDDCLDHRHKRGQLPYLKKPV